MRLTDRDYEIINFIMNNNGATIEQLHKMFFPSYNMCSKRMKKLADNGAIKECMHPTLNKKVFYYKKIPSYHSLIINDLVIQLKDKLQYYEREYPIDKFKIDCMMLFNNNHIIAVEIDLFNRTSENKVKKVYDKITQLDKAASVLIVSKCKRMDKLDCKNKKINMINVKLDEMNNINNIIK